MKGHETEIDPVLDSWKWKYQNEETVMDSSLHETGALGPKGISVSKPYPPGSEEGTEKDCKSQREQMTPRKWCLPHTEGIVYI